MQESNEIKVLGIGGLSRCGKDTFVAIASDILKKNGYFPNRIAFADKLKGELATMLQMFGFKTDIYSNDPKIKTQNRPLMVWWGCQRRYESPGGLYWVDEVDRSLRIVKENMGTNLTDKLVYLISDVRFPNEAQWIHDKWKGWFIHLRRYQMSYEHEVFDAAPNEEEAKQDPLIRVMADYQLDWESRGIAPGQTVMEDPYLRNEVWKSLNACPVFNGKLSL